MNAPLTLPSGKAAWPKLPKFNPLWVLLAIVVVLGGFWVKDLSENWTPELTKGSLLFGVLIFFIKNFFK